MSRNFLIAFVIFILASGSGHAQQQDKYLFRIPGLEVKQGSDWWRRGTPASDFEYAELYKDRVHFGLNYLKPKNKEHIGHPDKDLSRLATTYWHRRGPLGSIMEKFNWFPGPVNTYHSDARLPASLIGMGCSMGGGLPVEMLVETWSEPVIGRVGLEVGTVASYLRPFQHFDIFETSPHIIGFSLDTAKDKACFHFVKDARDRGAHVRVFEGDLRPTLAKKAGKGYYHLLIVEPYKIGVETLHEDLMTKEGVAMCMDLLAPGGILCIHISNRYYEISPIYADIATNLNLTCVRGQDSFYDSKGPRSLDDLGRFTCEWVMLSRERRTLQDLKAPAWYEEAIEKELNEALKGRDWPEYRKKFLKSRAFWSEPKAKGKYLWTDDGPHSFNGLYRRDPTLAEFRSFLEESERNLRDYFRISPLTLRSSTRQLYEALEALNRQVVLRRNGGVNPEHD